MEENQGVWQSYKHFEKEGCITLSILRGQGDTDLPHSLVWVIHREDLRKELREVTSISEEIHLKFTKVIY